jgi:hypothetical protein
MYHIFGTSLTIIIENGDQYFFLKKKYPKILIVPHVKFYWMMKINNVNMMLWYSCNGVA